jgi:catechol 2,3-dioxygenase-like lactoylglutathione lyase family enzyme
MADNDITGIHHIGLVVRDMDAALTAFRRLGFRVGDPVYPGIPLAPGGDPVPVGSGNTHADFPRGFIELLAFAPEGRASLPAGANLVPLQVPDDQLTATRAVIEQTVKGLAARLDTAEGAHILVLTTRDADETATRLEADGIATSGARTAQRPITTAEGVQLAAVRFLEIHGAEPGLVEEGRVGAAEDAPASLLDAQTGLDHPNGANGLRECIICVDELRPTAERYERYLGVPPEYTDESATFDLATGRISLTTPAGLAARLPGERPHTVPGLSAYAIEVADLAATEDFLRAQGIALHRSADGRPFIPAAAALGAAVVLQQAERRPD